MQSSTSIKEWSMAVALAQSEFRAVGMSGENTYDKYVYAKLEDYVMAVRPILAKHGLSVVTSVDDVVPLEDRKTKNGGIEHAVRVKMTVRVVHNSGEWVESLCWGEGQDRADKAVYKAITGARKYALASALGLATGDDPEGDESVDQTPANNHQRNNGRQSRADGNATVSERQDILGKVIDALDGAFGKDKSAKSAAAAKAFGVKTFSEIQKMDINALRAGALKLHESLNAVGAQ